jgi:Domain of unknown function (DUF4032)
MQEFYERSFFFNLQREELEEIMKHKWVLSERAGQDVGFEIALFSWVRHHRAEWRISQLENNPPQSLF